jgi:polyhydroxyalkanoate synthesis repressor PhaR
MPLIIKRYRNRKLYNTQSKRYITLEEIEEIIKQQQEIKVIDNDSGNDITATTLTQIIFDLEKNKTGVLPVDLLFSLVQSSGKRIDEIRRNIFISLNFAHHFDIEIERRVKLLIDNGEVTKVEGNRLLDKLLSVGFKQENLIENVEGKILEFLKDREIPTRDDFKTLMNRMDTLSKEVEELVIEEEIEKGSEKKTQIIE